MAEIAALRFLSQRKGSKERGHSFKLSSQFTISSQVEYIVATTSVITGDFLLQTLNNPLLVEPDYFYDQDSPPTDSVASIAIPGVTD